MEPLGRGMVPEVAVDDHARPCVAGVVLVDPGADAMPAVVVEFGLRRKAGHGVDEEPMFVFWEDRVVPPREVPVRLPHGEVGSALALDFLRVGDSLESRCRGQPVQLPDSGEEFVAQERPGERDLVEGVVQLPLTWT